MLYPKKLNGLQSNRILIKEKNVLNFIKLSHVFTNINDLKSDWKSKWIDITISHILELGKDLDWLN